MPKVGAKYPRLSLVFREERTADIVRELAEGTLDLGLLALEADIGECAHAEIAKDTFVAALPKGHPLARKRRLALSDLNDAHVLLLDEGHCFGIRCWLSARTRRRARPASGRRASSR